ncbi:hypothetical protein NFI96_001900 [Prochilodus magdalenae]|nr:hypothetical protein NFI96_001900 [Prochilodus magdalenae]
MTHGGHHCSLEVCSGGCWVSQLLKTLKKLQRLDITLDILAETGIGKVVNSFRKHSDAGEVAKTLVHRWKKLVPKDSSSAAQPDPPPLKEPSKSEAQVSDPSSENNSSSERRSKKENSGSECRPSKSADKKGRAKRAPDKPKGGTDESKDSDLKKPSRSKEKSSSDCHPEEKEEQRKPEKKVSDITNKHRAKTPAKRRSAKGDVSIERDGKKKRGFSKNKKEKKRKPRAAGVEKDPEGEDFEMPSMSFEAYLSYDLEAPKRRKKSCDSKNPKRLKVDQREEPRVCVPSAKAGKEAPDTTVAIGEVELVYGPYGQILIGCVSLRLGFKGIGDGLAQGSPAPDLRRL